MLIEVNNLSKDYARPVRRGGSFGTLRTFLSRERVAVHAVQSITFGIDTGEMVGFIGPNGAGKSTTIKMLTGILSPTSGRIMVDGRNPQAERREHVRRIGVVFGQRSQLWWDLPTVETFELLRHIYRIDSVRWRENLDAFIDLLGLEPFLDSPVRQLSLGQRMRADLAAALLHDPAILFLDEPTIGLDVVAKERIRHFLTHINRERKVTVLLTTHDLSDIERLCPRVMLIDQGKLLYDNSLEALRDQFGRWRTIVVDLDEESSSVVEAGEQSSEIRLETAEVFNREGPRVWLRFDRKATGAAAVIAEMASRYPIRDLTVQEPDIERIVRDIYQNPSSLSAKPGQKDSP